MHCGLADPYTIVTKISSHSLQSFVLPDDLCKKYMVKTIKQKKCKSKAPANT